MSASHNPSESWQIESEMAVDDDDMDFEVCQQGVS